MGNKEPVMLSRDVIVAEARGVGEGSKHLRLKLRSGNVVWPAICFSWEGEMPVEGSRVDLVYSLSTDRYGPVRRRRRTAAHGAGPGHRAVDRLVSALTSRVF